ncbi:fibroin heavy chain-like [Anopheles ziemanni]|uniref:fibroin heavy chain-like n=1 Tax=Anopheles coustani TaxID=139045 RepID=UPI0026587633|nr:fibroin heavy chain-like [Anopheles coustani]XP_058178675.1 fibroin heavy chain-like [Anopheles ziemanni]
MVLGRFALLMLAGAVSHVNCWNSPNTYYPGVGDRTFGSNRGYGQGNAFGGAWNQGQFQGDQGLGPGFGNSQWGGDGKSYGSGGAGSGLPGSGYNGAVGNNGAPGNDNGAAFGSGQGLGFGNNGQFPTGPFQGGNYEGFTPGTGGATGSAGLGPDGSLGAPGLGAYGGSGGSSPAGGFNGAGSSTPVTSGSYGGPASGRPAGAGPAQHFGDAGLSSGGVRPEVKGSNPPSNGQQPTNIPSGTKEVGAGTGATTGASGPGAGAATPNVPFTVPGSRPGVVYYVNPAAIPASYPKPYGAPAGFGGYGGAGRYPWQGTGYVYRVPVAHVNPDGSYGFSYQTPHSTREEAGDSNGNVDGNYGFNNDGAKHNFSFSAGPDVDLRTGFGRNPSEIDPTDFGPQSVHSRGRVPTFLRNGADGWEGTIGGTPVTTGRPQGNGADGPSTTSGANSSNGPDDSTLRVLGLPTTSPSTGGSTPRDQTVRGTTEAYSNPNAGNQLGVVRNTATVSPIGSSNDRTTSSGIDEDGLTTQQDTEDSTDSVNSLRGSFNQATDGSDSQTTRRPQQSPIEQVVARPENDPRGSFANNNLGGPNDLQFPAGTGVGFRPTGGSLDDPNGLRNRASSSLGPNGVGSQTAGPRRDGSYPFGYQAPASTQQGAANGAGNVRGPFAYNNPAGRNDGFRSDGSFSAPNGLGPAGVSPPGGAGGVLGAGGFRGPGYDGRYQFGYRAPDSEREESSDGAGNVRGSYAYNNEAGRNDLQYVAGPGTGFRPTGGSLSVPNGLGGAGNGFGSGSSPGSGNGFGSGGAPGAGKGFGSGGAPRAGNGFGSGGGLGAGNGYGSGGAPGAGNGYGSGGGLGAGNGFGSGGAPGAGNGFGSGGGLGAGNGYGSGGAPGAGNGFGSGGAPGAGNGFGSGGGPGAGNGFGSGGAPGAGNGFESGGALGAGNAFGSGGGFNNRGGLGGPSTVTRSPQDVLPSGRWNTGNGAFATTSGSLQPDSASTSRNVADESTTGNFDDTQQTTTFGNGGRF